jgi:hypothetical protein
MNEYFSKHHEIIDNFRGEVNKRDFDVNYNAATEHLNKTERFLLKMELKRLSSVCTRAIDLRGLVDGECQLFDYQGQSHFLDSVGITAFNENVMIYGGYTFGVYEIVKNAKNSFRNIYKKGKLGPSVTENNEIKKKPSIEKLQYPAKLELLENYPDRAEERMNFAIAITLTLNNSAQVKTTSIDLSVSGIKFKLINEVTLFKGDQFTIAFTGLEKEFQFSKGSAFYFEVKNVLRDSSTQIIGCQRINIPERDGFERFLTGYIQGNKRRYKINLDNSLAALKSRSFEQYAIVKINELPIFMSKADADVTPRYALTTTNNQKIYQYWQDDNKQSTLQCLVNSTRFERLKVLQQEGKGLLVFSFIHQHKNNAFFYTIDHEQLRDDKAFFHQFLAFAASKSSFAITSLKVQPLQEEQAFSPFTLSTAITKQQSYLNSPLTDEVSEIVANLPYVVTATDLTATCDIEDYKALGYEGIDLERLKDFGDTCMDKQSVIDEITVSYGHQRQEIRFKYITPVKIKCGSSSWAGQSADFSVSGLKVDLDEPAVLSKGDIVHLTFPELQKITSAFDLKQLPYKVMRISKDKSVVNLRVSVKEHQHMGRSFFKLLINKNKDKLTPDEYAMLTPGLASALRTLYAVNMATPTAVIQSSGSRHKIETLVAGKHGYQSHKSLLSAMLRLSDRDNYYNLYPLLGNLHVGNLIEQEMKKLTASDNAVIELLYITINSNVLDVDKSVSIKLESELNTPEMKQFFIKRSLQHGDLFCMQILLSRRDEAQMEHLSPELAYIGSYAIHRGKQLEQEIFSVAGLIQLVDVTQEVLLRYFLNRD